MGKNQAYKAMQRSRVGSSNAAPDEIEDGLVRTLLCYSIIDSYSVSDFVDLFFVLLVAIIICDWKVLFFLFFLFFLRFNWYIHLNDHNLKCSKIDYLQS